MPPPKPPSSNKTPLASRPRPKPTTTTANPPKQPRDDDTPNLNPNPRKDTLPPLNQEEEQHLLSKTLTSLPPTLALLASFHHRNKNQHRLSPWWSHFDRLRRHLGKFLAAVEARVEEVERLGRLSAKARVKARAKLLQRGEDGGGGGDGEGDADGDAEDEVVVRAWYLARAVVPGGYLSVFLLLFSLSLSPFFLVLGGMLT